MSAHPWLPVERRPLRVLVVEDSPTVRALLVAMLASDPDIEVVGEAENGRAAVDEAVRLQPDLITMDVQMPELDGLAATREIMAVAPTPIIIVSATANQQSVALSLDATQAGALAVLPKPQGPADGDFEEQRAQFVRTAKAMAQVKVVRRWGPRRARPALASGPRPSGVTLARGGRPRLVAIGCSTGGPAALRRILDALPADFPVPVVVVQHMARGFVGGLASWLDGKGPLRVKVTTDGEALRAGVVYLAGDDRHLGVARAAGDGGALVARHADLPPIDGFRPSATHLFGSVAQVLGSAAVGIILTGMGSDGVTGLRDLHGAGAPVLAQDEATSVVFGMAKEAVRAGATDEVLPLDTIPTRLLELVL